MPMFQVDHGRSVPLPQHEPAGARTGSEPRGVLGEGLDALLAEHLLPLRTRDGNGDEPYLLAVDASGQPVVVEVVPVLDEVALLQALRHTGRAARLSTSEIARAYRAGADRFTADLEAFRQTVPVTSLLSTTVNGGARLLLVCGDVGPGMRDVIEFLLQPGCQVDVLRVGLIQGADGNRILDVSSLTREAPARRGLEATVVHRLRSVPLATTVLSSVPAVPSAPSTPPQQRSAAVLTPPRWPADQRAEPTRRIPTLVPPAFATRIGSLDLPEPRVSAPEPAAPLTSADAHRFVPAADLEDRRRDLPYVFTGAAPAVRVPDPRLVRLATRVGAPAVLVWHRERRGEWFEALLHPDGWIELPDGSRHTDPSTAAVAVSGSSAAVDGWNVWRLDSPLGDTLAEMSPR